MARNFLSDRYADLYLRSRRVTILVSEKQPSNIYAVIFNCAIGMKANSGREYCHARDRVSNKRRQP